MTRLQPFFYSIEIFIGNLHLVEINNIIVKELKGKSGIYGFLSKTSNKLYIGSSNNLNIRINNHIKGTQSNILLQRAINKYNLQDFILIIFEYHDAENLITREQFYLDTLKPEFNILKVAGSLLGFNHSEETKALMSKAKIGKNNPMFGVVRSGEGHPRGMLGKCHSTETLGKISASMGTAIYVHDSEGSLVNTFSSARKAAEHYNSSHSTIIKHVKNNKLFQSKWFLSYSKIFTGGSSKSSLEK